MNDGWSNVLTLLMIEEKLRTRQVCKEWELRFNGCLPYICSEYDLHPCVSVKELITAYAHSRLVWRFVPSFSRIETNSYHTLKSFRHWVKFTHPLSPVWKELNDQDFVKKLNEYKVLASHSFLTAMCDEALNRSMDFRYTIFKKLVVVGVSPYYLELFLTNRLFCTRLRGRNYLRLIVAERSEYLLKRELKAKQRVAVDWERGHEITAKYKARWKGK